MARVVTDSQHYTDIVNALSTLRENKTDFDGGIGKLKPSEIAHHIEVVGDEVYKKGYSDAEVKIMLDPYVNNNATAIGDYAYENCKVMLSAEFPVVTSIGAYAFNGCSKLRNGEFPLATSIGTYAFNGTPIEGANFSAVTSIGEGAFYGCKGALHNISFPVVKTIEIDAFRECVNMRSASFPSATSIKARVFYGCDNLVSADFPNVTSTNGSIFQGCKKLKTVNMPKVTSFGGQALYGCDAVEILDFPVLGTIPANCFYSCDILKALVLRRGSICSLGGTNALGKTKIADGTGYIYVPRALVDNYKSATNWSAYASQFRALEDYTVDGTTTGALDESKI